MKVCLLIILSLVVSSCVWRPDKTGDPKLIVCTTTIIGDAVKQLVGDRYDVKVLMGPGVDPHIYEAKPSDIRALGNSRVIVYNGLHLEGKMTELFERIGREKVTIAFSDGMDTGKLIFVNEHTNDPHVWFDPDLWLQGIKHCALQLATTYPRDKQFIIANYKRIEGDIKRLKLELTLKINGIPIEDRVMITSHDAFHYFGKAFNVEVLALQGISTVSEPGLKDVSNLVNLIVERKIKAVFVESSVSAKSIRAVREACRKKNHVLKQGGIMYSDALGGAKTGADNYIGMMRSNVNTLVYGLK
jgi:manganese/zinc/iron transport system substrate-binding protein